MKNRKILYGYQVQNGDLIVHSEESIIVRQINTLYLNGLSYQKIAERLNAEGIPFSQESFLWNKHKVKRLLENPRYAGADGYPAILDISTFQSVQCKIKSKRDGYTMTERLPVLDMEPYLRCACGGKLRWSVRSRRSTKILHLKCSDCEKRITVMAESLLNELSDQIAAYATHTKECCIPSSEVVRLTNAINRGLEHPDTPEEVVSLILQGISARYDCCPAPIEGFTNLAEADFKRFCQMVSYITISDKNMITVYFK